MKVLFFISFTLILLFSCKPGNHRRVRNSNTVLSDSATSTTGKVIAILDGDTYDILLNGNTPTRIRMEGIDAPEKGMPYYKVAKNYLGQLCFGKEVRLQITGKDHHDRTLAFSYLADGTELSHEMIKAGLIFILSGILGCRDFGFGSLLVFHDLCAKNVGYVEQNLSRRPRRIVGRNDVFYFLLMELAAKPWKSIRCRRWLRIPLKPKLDRILADLSDLVIRGKRSVVGEQAGVGNVGDFCVSSDLSRRPLFLARRSIFSI